MSDRASWRSFFVALGVVVTVVAVVLVVIVLVVRSAFSQDDVTDLKQYASFRGSVGVSGAHFPVSIPPSAQKAQMRWTPGFLQGSTRLELRYGLPPAEATAYEAGLPAESAFERYSEDWIRIQYVGLLGSDDGPTPQLKDLTGRYRVHIMHASGNWNHPCVGAVLVDPETGEVVFVAE